MLLEVTHETRYRYSAPVSLAHHLAHLQPLSDAHQDLLAHDLLTEPEGETRHAGTDAFGRAALGAAQKLAPEKGMKILREESFNPKDTDMTAQVLKAFRETPMYKAVVDDKMRLGSKTMMAMGNLYSAALPGWLAAGLEEAALLPFGIEPGFHFGGREGLLEHDQVRARL